jgi:hypothetical protein
MIHHKMAVIYLKLILYCGHSSVNNKKGATTCIQKTNFFLDNGLFTDARIPLILFDL